ncbi:outer membrane protein assembly factor [Mangrovimonas sp. AS39]|uniref:BamA/TamA family outer membrane protein n=1 Tax=Mangrovimonas futianensis TaxID=2895523 RepID=UPI001E423B83|nr:BamA/TamA family outer membrane protein [Mangrovimonas futianensis]MCF1193020.1 outer membrane protein assembly factor [Mangrovimonas futianensis]MCF1196711.1 outer membrane protein assembly factor [Mangrovimonas futianensis]MCF1421510.1 outer membrane protein assembly factor [Mangrovimonas futianensis]
MTNKKNRQNKWYHITLCYVILFLVPFTIIGQQTTDSTSIEKPSKFDKFNKKAEYLFTYIPVPIYSYSSEAGHTYGLAKFNVFNLYKNDTLTKPSRLSEVVTFSSEGRINASVSTDLMFKNNDYLIISYINYKKTPEYFLGIGNDVSIDDIEQISTNRFKFEAWGLKKMKVKNLYAGIGLDLTDYFDIEANPDSYLYSNNVIGNEGGFAFGLKAIAAIEGRENRYNAQGGHFAQISYTLYPSFLGSEFKFSSWEIDLRKYLNPWSNHIIAFQATTFGTSGDVPFYALAQLGGDKQMRGYYKGAIRDKILVDSQLEYRLPIWNIFGMVGWVGTGRVASKYRDLKLDGFWLNYGAGLRIMVDSKHQTNLRFDWGFGPNGIHGFNISFAEAF